MQDTKEVQTEFKPKILAFCCNWCAYAGADLAGVSRFQMPTNVRVIRVMCSGRVPPELVIRALANGLDGVMILGCHPGECHYSEGNYLTRRRAHVLKRLLEYIGIEPERFQLRWVSAAEGAKFSAVVKETADKITALGPNRWGDKR
ncbi:MAG: hydrogenase iron-sulfur subunit [Dehalococcoidia bacterium]|nr:hydrogenase iron-sulfur subunit [Dehalococcoidia bacterium]